MRRPASGAPAAPGDGSSAGFDNDGGAAPEDSLRPGGKFSAVTVEDHPPGDRALALPVVPPAVQDPSGPLPRSIAPQRIDRGGSLMRRERIVQIRQSVEAVDKRNGTASAGL